MPPASDASNITAQPLGRLHKCTQRWRGVHERHWRWVASLTCSTQSVAGVNVLSLANGAKHSCHQQHIATAARTAAAERTALVPLLPEATAVNSRRLHRHGQ
jgi:hypothetical protein